VHDEAPSASQTDWPQILALYGVLRRYLDSPVVVLNQAVAAAMVHGPLAGHAEEAVAQYQEAARLTTSEPERRYLQGHAARLTQPTGTG